jgi:hypothetical protein
VSDSVKKDCNKKYNTETNNQQKDIGDATEYEGLVTLDPIGLLIEHPSFRLNKLADNDLIV